MKASLRAAIFGAFVALAMIAVGCSSDDSDDSVETTPATVTSVTSAVTTTTTAPPKAGGSIKVGDVVLPEGVVAAGDHGLPVVATRAGRAAKTAAPQA